MKKQIRLFGRYMLLAAVFGAACVGATALACMPGWMARAGGAVGCGWWALRYICWAVERPRKVRK